MLLRLLLVGTVAPGLEPPPYLVSRPFVGVTTLAPCPWIRVVPLDSCCVLTGFIAYIRRAKFRRSKGSLLPKEHHSYP